MQYGHCVVSATATAINSLYLSGITPSLKAASSNATNALKASGASWPSVLSFVRFFMSYIGNSLLTIYSLVHPPKASTHSTVVPARNKVRAEIVGTSRRAPKLESKAWVQQHSARSLATLLTPFLKSCRLRRIFQNS